MADTIFISFRHGDGEDIALALHHHLQLEFPTADIVRNVDGQLRGDGFARFVQRVATSDVALVIIGPRWLKKAELVRNHYDPVTIEIEAALGGAKLTIPVLVGGAAMPSADMLPAPIRRLAFRQAVALNPQRFMADTRALVGDLKVHFAGGKEAEQQAAERRQREQLAEAEELNKRATGAMMQHQPGESAEQIRQSKELATWELIKDHGDIEALHYYLARFPDGATARAAKAKLEDLAAAARAQEAASGKREEKPKSRWPWRQRPHRAEATAFCPKRLRAGEVETVQVMVHMRNRRNKSLAKAREADRRSYFAAPGKPLGAIGIADQVTVDLTANGARVLDQSETQAWNGETLTFAFRIISDGQANQVAFTALLTINGAHIGRIVFARPVSLRYTLADIMAAIRTPRLSRFKRVFFSYSSADRLHVLKVAREYEKFGVSFFQDALNLDPGERWKRRLWREIDRCDVFVLFWSTSAAKSEWVIKEIDRAWRRQARNRGLRPIIRPEVLEHPAPIPDQDWLREFHFDDAKYYRHQSG